MPGQQPLSIRGGGAWRTSRPTAPAQPQSQDGGYRSTGRARMDLIASVSRSSGLEKGGDDLKKREIQEEYREFIQGKLDQLMERHYPRCFLLETEAEKKQRVDGQENVLILFRKLREGVSASKRSDAFALEVYETSLYLAIIFESPRPPASIIPHLIPDVYQTASCPQPLRLASLLLSLLHHLATSYPSQSTYHQHRSSIPVSLLAEDSKAAHWLVSLTRSLRTRNYAQFERLSRKFDLPSILDEPITGALNFENLTVSRHKASWELANMAILVTLDALRMKARDSFWMVVRSAYRELTCSPSSMATKKWMSRSLCFTSVLSDELTTEPETWLAEKSEQGHTRRAEGVEGRWIICKVR